MLNKVNTKLMKHAVYINRINYAFFFFILAFRNFFLQFQLPYFKYFWGQPFLRLRETHNALQLPVFFFLLCCCSSCASLIRNIGEFGAKNYFTDHRTPNTIHGFRDSFEVLKIHGCYQDLQKFEQLSIQSRYAYSIETYCVHI